MISTGNHGCLPFIKEIPEILVGNFRSVRTVGVVTICLKFPDCRAALDWILVTTLNWYETQEICKW